MRTGLFSYRRALLLITLLLASAAQAQQQVDIQGPAGSELFGYNVIALPNGNIVVSDPSAMVNGVTFVGAVYLYKPDGTLISTLVGSSQGDYIGNTVGAARITVLGNGNFVVPSPNWKNGSAAAAGAVTFGNANTGWGVGVTAVVGVGNSIVGSQTDDYVGRGGVTALSDGHYVVVSPLWDNGIVANAGAVTWADGTGSAPGPVGAFNSIVGLVDQDQIGASGVTALSNGHYVVASSGWNGARGAATRVTGGGPASGSVSAGNSLVGSTPFDSVGARVFKLTNGNYVVASSSWNGGHGAVTWVNAATAAPLGAVSAANSLVGSLATDKVGDDGVTVLSNGNYVVGSSYWNGNRGAVTWGSGTSGAIGTVDTNPSIKGGAPDDYIGYYAVALSNGNYVVYDPYWNGNRGAVTWGNGATGSNLTVSAANSLVGSLVDDGVGATVVALSNGHYVVGSADWNGKIGAATWGNGSNGTPKGAITAANSLLGSSANDAVGKYVIALANGNYVTSTANWNGNRGAVTWGNGSTGTTGSVSAGNSLVGTTADDFVGTDVIALSNGNYAAINFGWNNAGFSAVGSFTWGSGRGFTKGAVSTANSIYGQLPNDYVGIGVARAFSNGTYAVHSPTWSGDNTIPQRGAVTLVRGNMPFPGTINARSSVLGGKVSGGQSLSFDYNPTIDLLIVGRPGDGKVSLLRIDQLFRGDFEQR